jgi:hypothetical protein
MKELVKRAFGFLLYAVVFYLIFAYIADMPLRWSIVLALVIAGIHRHLLYVAPKTVRRFTPYYMNVIPNWYVILSDYKIISGKEHWRKIQDTWEDRPRPQYVFIRDGMSFVFVSQSDDFERTLIFSNDYNFFMSEIDMGEELYGLTMPHHRNTLQNVFGDYQPRFFIKYGIEGYDLGVEVESDWWKSMKSTCPEPLAERQEHAYGITKLILAKVPLQEFTPYWEPVEYDLTFNDQYEKRQRQGREKYGWTLLKSRDDDEVRTRQSTQIDHKYFSVEHSEI